jgi:O-antigen/teichoic acid export membrane protein
MILSNHQKVVSLRNCLTSLVSSSLGRNTLWALSGYGLRLVIQAAYFILITRSLGVKQYGGFIGATALAAMVSPFVGLGSGNLLVKNVARDRQLFREYWGNGLLMTLVSGFALACFLVPTSLLVLPRAIPLHVILLVSVSDLILVKFLDMAAWAFQGFERLMSNAQLNVLVSLTRLIGIAGLALVVPHPSITAWATIYLAGSFLAAVVAVTWATCSLGTPKLALRRLRSEGVEGIYFSFSSSAQMAHNDLDKTMVARLATLEAAGIYAAAYRLIDVAFIPVRALLNAAYPGFFRTGAEGLQASLRYGRRLLTRIIFYPLFAFLALMVGAPLLQYVLGKEYAGVTQAVRWLALLPLLKTLHYFVADSLTGAGHQGLRTSIQAAVVVFNILINLWIIPLYGWRGAAWSSLASDALLFMGLWLAATYLRRAAYLGCKPVAVETAFAGRS